MHLKAAQITTSSQVVRMKTLLLCLFLLSTICLGNLVDDPECTINGGKLCAGAGCCYDNGQVIDHPKSSCYYDNEKQDWFCCCDKKHCAATKDDCPSKCLPEETEAQADDIQVLFKKFLSTLFL